MNLDIQQKQEHVQQDLQSMQESLEKFKSSLEQDATLATKQECVLLIKNIVQQMSQVDGNKDILDLQKRLESPDALSGELLQDILQSFIALKLTYTASVIDAEAEQLLEKYTGLVSQKSELDDLLSSLEDPDSYQIDPNVPVVAPNQPPLDVDTSDVVHDDSPWYEKTWNWMKEKTTNTISYVKENPGKSLLFAGTLGIGYGLYKWFSSDKKEKSSTESSDKGMSWWKKGLLALGGVGVGRGLWKNKDRIMQWLGFSEKLSFDDALKKVQGDINNISEIDIKTGIGEITYNDSSKEIQSYKNVGTKIEKSNNNIPGLDIDFSDYEQMIFTANFINYLKYHNKGKGVNNSPFFVGKNRGNIYMKTNVGGKEQNTDVLSGGIWSTLANFAPDVDGGVWKKTLSLFGLKDNKGKEKLVAYLNGLDIWEKGDAPNQENPNNDPIVAEANEVHDDIRNTIHDIEQHGVTRGTIQAEKVPGKDMYDIQSWDGSTKIEILSGGMFRVEGMDIIIPTANEAIRIANFSNKMQKENANQGASTAPFSYEREYGGWRGIYIHLKNSPNRTSNKLRVLTNDALQSTMPTLYNGNNEKYLVDYLNGLKNDKGNSIWN